MTEFETIKVEAFEGIAKIILNRPDVRNAINAPMRAELLRAVRWVTKSSDIRVAILGAAGDAFCAGADLAETLPEDQWVEDRINAEYKPFMMAIADSPKPFIGAVRGPAAGIGSAVVLVCDMVVMSDTAYLLQAFANIGLIPDGGMSWQLTQALGPKLAFELLMNGEKIPARTCLDYRLVNTVVADAELDATAEALARKIISRAPLSVRYTKEAVRKGIGMTLADAISLEAQLQTVPRDSEDFVEGRRAFFEKRAPNWSGK